MKCRTKEVTKAFKKLKLNVLQPIKYKDLFYVIRKIVERRHIKKAKKIFKKTDKRNKIVTYDQVTNMLKQFPMEDKEFNKIFKYLDEVESGFITRHKFYEIYYFLTQPEELIQEVLKVI